MAHKHSKALAPTDITVSGGSQRQMMKTSDSPHNYLFQPQEFAWLTGLQLRGFTVTHKPAGWQIVVRAFSKKGEPVYSLMVAVELLDCYDNLFALLARYDSSDHWYFDRFAPLVGQS